MMEPQPSIISNAIANKLSLIPDNMKTEMGKTENISFNRQHQYCSLESVEFTVSLSLTWDRNYIYFFSI